MKDKFRKLITHNKISVKYARGESDMEGKEFHPFNEIIFFLGGSGTFISDDMHLELKPDILFVIPKESYHQMCISGDKEEYHRLVLHFGDIAELEPIVKRKLTRVLATGISASLRYLLDKLLVITQAGKCDEESEAVVLAVLTLLLDELSETELVGSRDALSYKFVDYIDRNIGDRISVLDIAQEFGMSESGVAHAFRREMNISVYKYILKKRLMLAHKQILDGKNPTEAAIECGFGDYSGFYKQYRKMFGAAPSSFKNKNAEL
ncbi:MAG: helix-turn-helix domain-containing protein [Clostridia bacterium]|nr:helix-turn-helix domain-containing protein [Clostridia bacterium]